MNELLIFGALTGLGVIILFFRVGLRRVLSIGVAVDIVISLSLVAFFIGTFSGLMTAAVAGIVISAFLLLTRIFIRPRKT